MLKVKSVFILLLLAVPLFGQTAKVRYMIGEVRLKPVASGQWTMLTMDTPLHEHDILRTGVEAFCEIELPDGSTAKLLQNSILELRDFPDAQSKDLSLFSGLGRFFFNVRKILNRKFSVISPASVAAVRGTQFMTINDAGKTSLLVRKGRIDFSDINFKHIVSVPAGQKSVLVAGEAPTAPVPLTKEELQALDKLAAPPSAPKQPIKTNNVPAPKPQKVRQPERNLPPPAPSPAPQVPENPKNPASQTTKPGRRGHGLNTGLTVGAVTIDGRLYNQIGIRPEFSIGKLGVALDLTLYIDDKGNIRKDNWDSFRDIFEKIYYIRWAHRGDPFYARVGAIDNYRLGFGILMNHYSNTVEYPNVIRTGLELGLQSRNNGFDMVLNNFSELTNGGGLVGARFSHRLLGKLQIGASFVYDRNQYKALRDRDKDGVPDYLDAFPDNKHYAVDTDGDGKPDPLDGDRDGNSFTDNKEWLIANGYDSTLINDPAYLADPVHWAETHLKPQPFNINKAKDKAQFAFALDASYPILNYKYLQLTTYAQWAQFPYNKGWGITAPGFLAKFAFINAYAEYRIFGEHFLPEYFNTTYELERSVFVAARDSMNTIKPVSKRALLDNINERLKGYVIGADFNLFDFFIFGAEYQNMSKSNFKIRTFRSSLDLNTSFIPKIRRAGAYFYQNNARKLFTRTEGTILGYRLEYEISGGASLLFDYRQTYRDLNGDGKISGSNETVRTTNIQTVIRF